MSKALRIALTGIVGVVVVGGLLYWSGFKIMSPSGQPILSKSDEAGDARNKPGWRRAGDAAVPPGAAFESEEDSAGSGQRGKRRNKEMSATGPGGNGQGEGRQQNLAAARQPGSGQGRAGRVRGGGTQDPSSQQSLLLQSQLGSDPISIIVAGKQKAQFIGKDLNDHVEDTVIATTEGAIKGWSVANTLKYFGWEQPKEAVVINRDGKRLTVTQNQIQSQETLVLFGYDQTGHLILISGPKVRGTNKGQTSPDQVKKLVAGRQDLLRFTDIVKIEVRG